MKYDSEMKYDKIIFSCNDSECQVEYVHLYVRHDLQNYEIPCPYCGARFLVFCEYIENAGKMK